MEIPPLLFVDKRSLLAPTPIVVDDYFVVDNIYLLSVTMPTSHNYNNDMSGSNGLDFLVKYPMESTTILVCPLQIHDNQSTIITYHPNDTLVALLACHVNHGIII